jgi:hypothetical protein
VPPQIHYTVFISNVQYKNSNLTKNKAIPGFAGYFEMIKC